ncbi:Flp family type IVb pilin [Pseudorhizobium marinum]|uniref:Flp family type IVb pilin n=1 Tax=Pseudorhizobium marinum TaxID=1496690 RepID=UPI0004982CED|nr:Flp family type IVb pilin [Pseudorhizobium marinum]
MMKLFARFRSDESGATAIEYGLIAALISVALIAGASTLGNSLDNAFKGVAGKMDDATNKGTTPAPSAGG